MYLDHNATTATIQEAWDAMRSVFGCHLNASSIHAYGRKANAILNQARTDILEHLGFNKDEYRVIFASSGTEINNWIITKAEGGIITSTIEHASIHGLQNTRQDILQIGVNEEGIINLAVLEEALATGTYKLVSIIAANNETGILQPLQSISLLCKAHGVLLHTDAVQVLGKTSMDIAYCDFVTVSSHKVGGPCGIAALILRKDRHIEPMVLGGGQEFGLRSGTQSVMLALGFAAAIKKLKDYDLAATATLRDHLECSLRGAIIIGKSSPRLVNTSTVVMPGVDRTQQLIKFDMAQIAVSSGAACSSGKVSSSHVLEAMGIPQELSRCAIRVSLWHDTTPAEIEYFVSTWHKINGRG